MGNHVLPFGPASPGWAREGGLTEEQEAGEEDGQAGEENGGGEGGAVGHQGPWPHPSKEGEDPGHQGGKGNLRVQGVLEKEHAL